MLAERDEGHLVVHVHLVAQSQDLFGKPGLPLWCRMGLQLHEQHQCSGLLRLSEIFPQGRDPVAVRQDARLDRGIVQLLDVGIWVSGYLRSVEDDQGIVGCEVDVEFHAFHSELLGSLEACQGILERARMGVIAPVRHYLGLGRQQRHRNECCRQDGNELFHHLLICLLVFLDLLPARPCASGN